MTYRELSIVEAVQWKGDNFDEITGLLSSGHFAVGQDSGKDQKTSKPNQPTSTEVLIIHNPPHGSLWLKPMDWLVIKGKSCKIVYEQDFNKKYLPLKAPAAS